MKDKEDFVTVYKIRIILCYRIAFQKNSLVYNIVTLTI